MHVFRVYIQSEFSFKNSSLKTLIVFSAIFVADTKIIFRYDFVAPLRSFGKAFYKMFQHL